MSEQPPAIPPSIPPRAPRQRPGNTPRRNPVQLPRSVEPNPQRRSIRPTAPDTVADRAAQRQAALRAEQQPPRIYPARSEQPEAPRRRVHPTAPSGNAETRHRAHTFPSSPNAPGATKPVPSRPTMPLRKKLKITATILITIPLVLLLVTGLWVNSLWNLSDENLKHVNALSGRPDTAGTTYLIAGSDSRADAHFKDDTEGERTDTIMLLHHAKNGQVSLISLPRDSFVNIPGHGDNKINAAYALGGPQLLVETVEQLTGLTVDHYVEVGMGGITNAVDAVDGVNLCLDYNVDDEYSQLKWQAGCHTADGRTALAFARMRYADPLGDIGRAERQRQVISGLMQKVFNRETYTSPTRIKNLVGAVSTSVTTDNDTKSYDLGWMAWYFRNAHKAGLTGAPPIASLDYETYAGSAVLLNPETAPEFFEKLASGTLEPADLNQRPE